MYIIYIVALQTAVGNILTEARNLDDASDRQQRINVARGM